MKYPQFPRLPVTASDFCAFLVIVNALFFLFENPLTPFLWKPFLILRPACVALFISASAYSAGCLCLRFLCNEQDIPLPFRFFIQVMLGLQVLVFTVLALCASHLLNPWSLKALLIVLCGLLFFQKKLWKAPAAFQRQFPSQSFLKGSGQTFVHKSLPSSHEDLHWDKGMVETPVLPWTLIQKIMLCTVLGLALLLFLKANSHFSGYDSLVYHMAVPKAYMDAGQIVFLPSNVYSQFPLNAEILNLMCLLLQCESACKYLILIQIFLSSVLAAFFLWQYTGSRSWALLSLLWIGSLSLNYEQLILGDIDTYLMFSALVFFLHLIQCPFRKDSDFVLSGVLAGITIGFKYLAIPFIVFPAFLFLLFRTPFLLNSKRLLFWLGAVLLTFSPWLLKNIIFTGNPVFPFLSALFTQAHWSPEQFVVFSKAHSVKHGAVGDTLYAFFSRMDGALFLSLLFWLSIHRSFWKLVCLWILPVLGWLFFSQGNLRYILPMYPLWLIFTFLLLDRGKSKALWILLFGIALLRCFGLGILSLETLPYDLNLKPHTLQLQKLSTPYFSVMAHLNETLPPEANVLMINEARTYPANFRVRAATLFDKNPLENVLTSSETLSEILRKLKEQGFTHLLINQAERERLQNAYGKYFPCEAGFHFKPNSKESSLFLELFLYVFSNNLLKGADTQWVGICWIP